jgi:hypothetical protein
MKNRSYWIFVVSLIIVAILIHLFSYNSGQVEHFYSTGIYPRIAIALRYFLTWVPFSLGDFLYGYVVLWLIWKLIGAIRRIAKNQLDRSRMKLFFKRGLVKLLLIYILFNLLWGINYNRRGIASQIGLAMESYTVADVKTLNTVLIQKVNNSKKILLEREPRKLKSREIFDRANAAYEQANTRYPFLYYHPSSIKVSMWGWLGNYLGFLGYYNPFTGEAQVNTSVPKFSQPYTTCHEIAHQLGYAKENEANFVGYLAAAASNDPAFHYSVYLDLFLYAERNLYKADTAAAKMFLSQLLPEVKNDIKEWQKFHNRHKNPAEPVIRWLYGKYLENNQQPSGVLSYDEVTGFMISYYKKYNKL